MFQFIDRKQLGWSAKEVVRDVDIGPRLFVRLALVGPYFPERALEPFARAGGVRSRLVRITDGGRRALAYFDEPISDGVAIEFGYGEQVLYRFPRRFGNHLLERLDRQRLPAEIEIPPNL
jgi:hypothetical protein